MSSNQSIKLYETLKRLTKTQFGEVCFYLKKEYDYDFSHVDLDKAPSESANQLIELIEQYPQGLTHLSKVIDKVAPQKKIKLNIPDLRPHLANRGSQENKLTNVIRHHNKQFPLVCLIHGDECQCSDNFLERLEKFYLPTVVHGDWIISHYVPCDFPENVEELHDDISQRLGVELLNNRLASCSEIVDAIVNKQNSIILHTDMCTKNWSRCGGMKLIHDFIEFWAKWELPPTHNHLLLICLYFNYKDIKPTHFLTRWFKKKSINDQIRAEFGRLEKENFSEKFGINGIVLPELVNIEKEDVYKWAKSLYSSLDSVKFKIDALFKSHDETIPMCDLASSLREILEEFPPDILGFNNDR